MFNKIVSRAASLSILSTLVVAVFILQVSCQENTKDDLEILPAGVELQKLDRNTLISKSICSEKDKGFTILSNLKNPLRIEKAESFHYTNFTLKIYLLSDKTYTGKIFSKDYDTNTKTPIRKTSERPIKGLWEEKNDHIHLLGLGKLRVVKHLTEGVRPEDIKQTQIEFVVTSSTVGFDVSDYPEVARTTALFVEQVGEGPNEQKIDEICAPVN